VGAAGSISAASCCLRRAGDLTISSSSNSLPAGYSGVRGELHRRDAGGGKHCSTVSSGTPRGKAVHWPCARMNFTWRIFERRTLWWPTRLGWTCLLLPPLALLLGWCFYGEAFLSPTSRVPSNVLVVEGWAGRDSMAAAAREFQGSGYRLLVAAGGPTGDSWAARNWNYAELAAEELVRHGLPKDQLLVAPTNESENQRTYHAALAVRRALEARGPLPAAINVWTRSTHARRSRLVFAKVFGSKTHVGVIAWSRTGSLAKPWWRSSERSRDFLEETVGYFFERLLNSGRWSSGVSLPAR